MTRFRRRTYDYEAVQYTGANLPEIIEFYAESAVIKVQVSDDDRVSISRGGAFLHFVPSDWLVKAGATYRVVADRDFRLEFEAETGPGGMKFGAELDKAFKAASDREAMARRIERYANGPLPGETL